MSLQLALTYAAKEGDVVKSAVISPCGKYRYLLGRVWQSSIEPVTFLLLNPSTANAAIDDPTLKKCMTYAREWEFGGVHIVNLFAFRTKSPRVLLQAAKAGEEIVGTENDGYLRKVLAATGIVVCGWGNMPGKDVFRTTTFFQSTFAAPQARLVCLGTNDSGSPKHPLYLRNDTLPQAYLPLSI